MHDAGGVRSGKRRSDLAHKVQHIRERQITSSNQFANRMTVDEFRGDEVDAVQVAYFVNRENVWMVQGRSSASLSLKTAQPSVVRNKVGGQHFQRYETI